MASDPILAERWVTAFLSGLNDPSTTCSDVFRAIDPQALLDLVGLSAIEERILFAEWRLFTMTDESYGAKSVSQPVDYRRGEIGGFVEDAIKQGYHAGRYATADLVQHMKTASWDIHQAAKHLGRLASDMEGLGDEDAIHISTGMMAVEMASVMSSVFGNDAQYVNVEAVSDSFVFETADGQRKEPLSIFLRLHKVFVETTQQPNQELYSVVLHKAGMDRNAGSSSKSFAANLSAIVSGLLELEDTIYGPLFVQGFDTLAEEMRHNAPDWAKVIDGISPGLRANPAGAETWNASFFNGVLTAANAKGEPALNYIWGLSNEPVRQTSFLSTLFRALPSLDASTLPEEHKLVHMPTLHSEVAENEGYTLNVRTAVEAVSAQSESSIWNIKNMLPTLFALSERQQHESEDEVQLAQTVREMFEHGTRNSPELVLLSILELKVSLMISGEAFR